MDSAKQPSDWRPAAARSAGCLALAVLGWLLDSVVSAHALGLIAYLLAYLAGAWDLAQDVWRDARNGRFDTDFLMLAVVPGAAVIGAYGEAAFLLFLFSASSAMEEFAFGRTHREINALLKASPKTARRILPDGVNVEEIPVSELHPGDLVRVTSGEQVPVDFTVKRGESACDESMLTGESVPVPKLAEDVAYAGTVNGWGVLDGVVLRPAGDSALQRVIRLIQHAQHLKAPSQRFSERFGSGYTLFVLGAAATVFFVWWLGLGAAPFRGTETTPSAFYRAMTLMVVLSPCALVLSVPASVLSAIARGARSGVLFRGGAALESLADVGVMAMDKTGTLTFGKLTVTGLLTINGSAETAWTAAASLAHVSSHPASRSIARHAVASGIAAEALEAAENFPGHGLRGLWRGGLAALGRREFIAGFLPPFVRQQMPPALDGRSEVWVYAEGVLARIELSDAIRPEARTLVARLQNDGIRVVMLTGDKSSAANAMAKEAGVDEVRAELRPEGKVEAIQRMKASGCRVAMVGDGVNDAPCLAAADVGVAMGAHGSDAAIEQAEVVLMHDGLEGLLFARDLSKKAQGVIRQNLLFALGIIVFMGIATLVTHRVPLFLGVLAHEGSTVLVVLNSLRLLAFRPATV